jgi:hypothetical protein
MRLFFGIILGFFLTVGGTYVADPGSKMVNWDVVRKKHRRPRELRPRKLEEDHRLTAIFPPPIPPLPVRAPAAAPP